MSIMSGRVLREHPDTKDVGVRIEHPSIPTATAASGVGAGAFTANWTASTPASRLMYYSLQLSMNQEFSSFVTGFELKTVEGLSLAISGLAPGTYYYRVYAFGYGGHHGPSNVISVVVP